MSTSLPIPSEITILVDTREQTPLKFPQNFRWESASRTHLIAIKTEARKLEDGGDYAVKGFEDLCRLERKGSITELHKNLRTSDSARFNRSLGKLKAACRVPIVFVDIPIGDLYRTNPYVGDPSGIFDKLIRTVTRYGGQVYWIPPAGSDKNLTRSGEITCRLLWNVVYSLRTPVSLLFDKTGPAVIGR